jgi:hypothetical protein
MAPTRKVQEQQLGDWTSDDGKERLKLRKLDNSIYIVYYDGDLFRAYHSDVAETSFATVLHLIARSQVRLGGLEIVERWQGTEIAERQRQGCPKANQRLSHGSWSPDKKR